MSVSNHKSWYSQFQYAGMSYYGFAREGSGPYPKAELRITNKGGKTWKNTNCYRHTRKRKLGRWKTKNTWNTLLLLKTCFCVPTEKIYLQTLDIKEIKNIQVNINKSASVADRYQSLSPSKDEIAPVVSTNDEDSTNEDCIFCSQPYKDSCGEQWICCTWGTCWYWQWEWKSYVIYFYRPKWKYRKKQSVIFVKF